MSVDVMPRGDLIEHEPGDDCVCVPAALPVSSDHGAHLGWVHVHHSLDGREQREGDST
ncbi:MAG: hypothetical protein ACRCZP_03080 [Phycicoccus sp.]